MHIREFDNPLAFATHLLGRIAAVEIAFQVGLDKAAAIIQQEAKGELGHYQKATGPFPAWQQLAESTKADRLRQGYSENEPGLRSGAARDSIEREVRGLEAVVGSEDQNLVYFELGTSKQPPRPVFGSAAMRKRERVMRIIGEAAAAGLLYGDAQYSAHLPGKEGGDHK